MQMFIAITKHYAMLIVHCVIYGCIISLIFKVNQDASHDGVQMVKASTSNDPTSIRTADYFKLVLHLQVDILCLDFNWEIDDTDRLHHVKCICTILPSLQ